MKSLRFIMTIMMLIAACQFSVFASAKDEKEILFGLLLNPVIKQLSYSGKGAADVQEIFQKGSVEEKDYDIFLKWLKEAGKKGWNKEFDEIMKKVPKPRKK